MILQELRKDFEYWNNRDTNTLINELVEERLDKLTKIYQDEVTKALETLLSRNRKDKMLNARYYINEVQRRIK